MTDYSSPYREMGERSQATQPKRRRVPSDRLFISKKETKNAGTGHQWTISFKLGKKCVKCGQPAFAVEFDRCKSI